MKEKSKNNFMFKPIKSRIKYQLVITYMLIFLIGTLVLGGVIYYLMPNIIREKYEQYTEELNHQIVLTVENNLNELQRISMMLEQSENVKQLIEDNKNEDIYGGQYQQVYKNVDKYFIEFIYSFQIIQGAYLYNLQGENVYTRNIEQARHKDINVKGEEWFEKTLDSGGYAVIRGRHDNESLNYSQAVISLSRPIIDFTNKMDVGVICVEQEVEELGKIVDGVRINGKSAVILLDDKDELIYTNNDELYLEIKNGLTKENNVEKNLFYVEREGKNKALICKNTIKNIGWKVITCDDNEKMQHDLQLITKALFFTFIACFGVVLIVSILLSKQISTKLEAMKKMANHIREGQLDVRVDVTGSDELAELGDGLNDMAQQLKNLIQKEYQETLLRKEAEINLLQAQINPHFLYNTLGSIKNLALEEKAVSTSNMIQCLATFFRYNSGKEKMMVTIEEEFEHVNNYLLLQRTRFEDKIIMKSCIQKEALYKKIPIMTLQPIVENAIVHGFENKCGKGLLEIECYICEENIIISAKDDGIGIDKEKLIKINHDLKHDSTIHQSNIPEQIGIFNVNARLKYKFGEQYGIIMEANSLGGVTTIVTIPSHYAESEGREYDTCGNSR